jgi:hypothetical protein
VTSAELPPHRSGTVTHEDLEHLVLVLARVCQAVVDPIKARLEALEARPPSPEYLGIFEQGKTYPRGGLVTRDGSLWLALTETTLTPGSHRTAWRLIVKSGDHAR